MFKVYSKITKFFQKGKLPIIFFLAFIFRLLLLPHGTHVSDMGLWHYWGAKMVALGPGQFYQKVGFCDYLPFYLYFLGGLELIWQALSPHFALAKDVLFKIPATLADFATAYLLYLILKKKSKEIALWLSVFYLFNPAVFINSSLWGQVDSIGALLLLATFFLLLKNRYIFAGFLMGFSLTMKPIYFLALPLAGVILWQKRPKETSWWLRYKSLRNYGAALFAGVILVSLPFSLTNPLGMLLKRYQLAVSVYPYTSVNSFNFWAIGNRWWQSDLVRFGLTYQHWGLLIVSLTIGLTFWLVWQSKKESNLWLSLATIFLALFTFATRTHERHLFTVLPFLTLLAGLNYLYWYPLLIISFVSSANLYFSLVWLLEGGRFVFNWSLINFFSCLITLMSLVLVGLVFRKIKINWQKVKKLVTSRRLLLFLLALAFLTRIWHLGWPTRFYFDEVYHAFTATEMAKGNVMAWEWWNQPPEGVAYEWTHPPLAKLFMTLGIFIFGENGFGWRFFGALLGTACVLLIYLLGKTLFYQKAALLAAFLFAFDGLPLVMSRIAMNDIYFLFFTLFSLWLFLKKRPLLAGLAFGLALASKWTALYLLPVLALWQLMQFLKQERKKKFDFVKENFFIFLVCFLFLPLAVYFFSYLPFFLTNHTFSQWWELQHQMWWYHTGLTATHAYQSSALSWPWLIRPVWFFVDYQPATRANIYAMGNPLIWWGGLVSLPFVLWQTWKRREKKLLLVIFAYLAFFLPWVFSPRIMFLYHYLPSVAFLCLFLGWALGWLEEKKPFFFLVVGYVSLVVLTFFFFYPHWIGLHVPLWLNKLFYWLPSWR